MLIRLIRYFTAPAVLGGFGGWAVGVGLPETGVLTPFWGWVLTGGGLAAVLGAISLSIRGVRLFKDESREIEARRPFIAELRKVLSDLESQIDDVCHTAEEVPLDEYETRYLSKFSDYPTFKKKYITENDATESDAQYVALGLHYGMKDNPLFSDSFKGSQAQLSVDRVRNIEQKLPDPRLRNLIDLLIDTKMMQSKSALDHKLNPARWKAHVSDISRRADVEYEFDKALRKVRREVDRRLAQLGNGAKYE